MRKITHKYFDSDYWMKPYTKSGYSPQQGYRKDGYVPGATAEFLVQLFGTVDGIWLEVGCAFGWIVERLYLDYGVNAWGFDISKYSIKNCPEAVKQSLSRSDGLNQNLYPANHFGFVYSFETAEHVAQVDVQNWINNIYHWMKPQGRLFMTICLGDNNFRGADDIDESHQTLQPREWWNERFFEAGFLPDTILMNTAKDISVETDKMKEPQNMALHYGWHVFGWGKP
jgi:cyclopropane fatty-acyl-phospholipid synthase-like methyltransferase